MKNKYTRMVSALSLALILVLGLCSCGKKTEDTNTTQIPNPMTEITAEEACKALGLKQADFGSAAAIGSVYTLNGTPQLYSFDLTVDGKELNLRVCRDGSDEKDISGIYLSEKKESAIFDSADADAAPSVYAEADKDYAKAYAEWMGYTFSLSGESMTVNEIAELAIQLVPLLLGAANHTN